MVCIAVHVLPCLFTVHLINGANTSLPVHNGTNAIIRIGIQQLLFLLISMLPYIIRMSLRLHLLQAKDQNQKSIVTTLKMKKRLLNKQMEGCVEHQTMQHSVSGCLASDNWRKMFLPFS